MHSPVITDWHVLSWRNAPSQCRDGRSPGSEIDNTLVNYKDSRFALCRYIIAVCFENSIKRVNALWVGNARFLNVKSCGTYSYPRALNG